MMTALDMEDEYIDDFLNKLWTDYAIKDYQTTEKKDSWLWKVPETVEKGYYKTENKSL